MQEKELTALNWHRYAFYYFAVLFRVQYIYKKVPLEKLHRFSRHYGRFFNFLHPAVGKKLLANFRLSFPDHTINDKTFIADYLTGFFFNCIVFAAYPFYSDKQVAAMFDASSLDKVIEELGPNDRIFIGAPHFYHFLFMSHVSRVFKDAKKQYLASFVLWEHWTIKYFFKKLYSKVKSQEVAEKINLHQGAANPFKVFRQNYGVNKASFCMFCDIGYNYWSKNKAKDSRFARATIGQQTYLINDTYKMAKTLLPEAKPYFAYLELQENYTFKIHIENLNNDYNIVTQSKLSELIEKHPTHWQFWATTHLFRKAEKIEDVK
ncbi:MAG: hypothetical protein QM528_03885 [Phycisphaerales bacterium]|nr:hypothetical protein [Phycisphaerales bacterium]